MPKADQPLHLPAFLPYQLSILQKRVSEIVGQFYRQEFNLSRNEWRVMAALALQGGMSAKEIGQYVQLEKMPVSRALKTLKESGYVEQDTDAGDKRLSRLELTESGVACYDAIVPQVLLQQTQVLDVLSEQEQQQLSGIIGKLLNHVEQLAEPPKD